MNTYVKYANTNINSNIYILVCITNISKTIVIYLYTYLLYIQFCVGSEAAGGPTLILMMIIMLRFIVPLKQAMHATNTQYF